MKEPLVSVIIPTHNCIPKRFKQSIDSVFSQTYQNIELIIIDDCSYNDVKPLIKDYIKSYKIICIRNTKNLGCTKSLNKGIMVSHGKYIARIDDDDIWNDYDKLEKQVKFMEENTDYGLCGVENIIIINEEGNTIDKVKNRTSDYDIRKNILQSNQFTHSSILFKKEIIEKVGLYNEKYVAAQDYEFICRIGTHYKFTNLRGISISYRINTKGISKTRHRLQYKNSWKTFWMNRNNYPNFYKALILRIGDFILPEKLKNYLLKFK